jgi:hypothetical protein
MDRDVFNSNSKVFIDQGCFSLLSQRHNERPFHGYRKHHGMEHRSFGFDTPAAGSGYPSIPRRDSSRSLPMYPGSPVADRKGYDYGDDQQRKNELLFKLMAP